MAKLVNLRQFRKKQKRAESEKKAVENRIIFGQTKIEKQFAKCQKTIEQNFLNNHHLLSKQGNTNDD